MENYLVNPCLEKKIKLDFPELKIKIDKNLHIYEKAMQQLQNSIKTISIRYKKDAICIPAANWIPYFEINKEEEKNGVGVIEILEVSLKKFYELNFNDAIKEGLCSKRELLDFLEEKYGKIKDKELISIYHLNLV